MSTFVSGMASPASSLRKFSQRRLGAVTNVPLFQRESITRTHNMTQLYSLVSILPTMLDDSTRSSCSPLVTMMSRQLRIKYSSLSLDKY